MFVGLAGYFLFCFFVYIFLTKEMIFMHKSQWHGLHIAENKTIHFCVCFSKRIYPLECLGTIFYHIDKCVLNHETPYSLDRTGLLGNVICLYFILTLRLKKYSYLNNSDMVIFLKHLVNTVIIVTLYFNRIHLRQKQISISLHSLE